MTDDARHLLVPAVAAPGHRQADHHAGPRRDGHGARVGRRRAAARRRAGRPAARRRPPTSTATSQLYGPGDIVGIDPRAIVRTEPRTGSPTSSRTTCRTSSSTTRTSRGATRRRRPTASGAAAAVARAGRAGGGRVHRRAQRRRAGRCPTSTVDRPRRCCPPADELWAWAHVHVNRTLAGGRRRVRLDRHGRRAAARCGAVLDENPDLAYSRLVCPRKLEAEHGLPRVPRPDLRERPAGRARPRPRRRAARHRSRRGRPRQPPERSLPVLLPLVLPHRRAGRLRVPGPAARAAAGRHARRARATSTCVDPGSNLPGIDRPRARRRPAARRRAAGAALATLHADRTELRSTSATRTGTQPVPAPVPGRARRVRQPGRRLRGRDAAGRQRRHRLGRRSTATPTR